MQKALLPLIVTCFIDYLCVIISQVLSFGQSMPSPQYCTFIHPRKFFFRDDNLVPISSYLHSAILSVTRSNRSQVIGHLFWYESRGCTALIIVLVVNCSL